MIAEWMSELMSAGGFQPREVPMLNHDSAHSQHTKKRHKKLRGRELKRREKQSRQMKKRGGKRQ